MNNNDKKNEAYISTGIGCILLPMCLILFLGLIFVIQIFPLLESSIVHTIPYLLLLFMLPICILIFMKESVLGAFRIMDYTKNKNYILECKSISKGKVIKINSAGKYGYGHRSSFNDQWQAYYLVVDLNGEIVKSIFFENNIYKIGQELDVVSYNGRKYVILETEK